jgi:hypothetical protein
MIQLPCKIPYTPGWTFIIGSGLFFAVCGASLAEEASTNDRGLVLEGIFHFSPQGATVSYWVLAGFSALFVLTTILLAGVRITISPFLEITSDAVIIPHGFLLRKTSRVQYSTIAALSEIVVKRHKLLRIRTPTGKFAINSSLLPSRNLYTEIKQFLIERTGRIAPTSTLSAETPPAGVS